MIDTETRSGFHTLIHELSEFIANQPLDEKLQAALNERFPAHGESYLRLLAI